MIQSMEVLLTEIAEQRDPGARSTHPGWLSVAAYVRGECRGVLHETAGAVTLPPGTQSPWNSAAVSEGLDQAVRSLAGMTLVSAEEANPLTQAREAARIVEDAGRDRAVTRWQRTGLACVAGAVEAGVLDLLARAQGIGLAESLGARRAAPSRSARAVQPQRDDDTLAAKITAQHGRFPVTRLAARGDLERDLRMLETAERANVAAGASKPLWLECSGRYSVAAAENLVSEAGALLTDRRLTSRVYLEQPIPRASRDELAALTLRARQFGVDATDTEHPADVRIVLDESVETPADVMYFLRHGHVSAVSVDPRRGVDSAIRIVEHVVEAAPDASVIVSAAGLVTDLEAVAAEAIARAVPKLDLYLSGLPSYRLTRHRGEDIDRGWSGQQQAASLPRLVAAMGRSAWHRCDPGPAFADPAHEPNEYSEYNEYQAAGLETLGKNSLDSYLLEKEAHRLGLATVRFRSVDFHVEDRTGRSVGFHCTTGPSTSRYVGKVCGDKQVARSLLARAGVAVPAGGVFAATDWPGASAFARRLEWPVVVKPPAGKGGRDVTSNIPDENELQRVLSAAARHGHERVIVEKHIMGADYRFLVVGSDVVSVVKRIPGGIVGDGRSTVAELVLAKNLTRLRNPHLRTRLLVLGEAALQLLRRRDMTPDSVPDKGEYVLLTTAANISRGGDSVEVLDETHPSLLEEAVRAVHAVPGLGHAGVDFLIEDHRRPLAEQSAGICELNSLPATTSHHYPAVGTPRNVSRALMEHYVAAYGLEVEPGAAPDTGKGSGAGTTTVSVGMRISGEVQQVGYRQWFANLGRQLGMSGWVRNAEQTDLVEAELTGSLDLVSAVSLQAIFGPGGSRPELVETRPVKVAHSGEFRFIS